MDTQKPTAPADRKFQNDLDRFLERNPSHGYGYACGYVTGSAAHKIGNQYAGLSIDQWRTATDDYAHGYRAAWQHTTAQ